MLSSDLDVENVLLFVGDAVRYDRTRDRLADRGELIKTVAASTHTPTSFSTMLSGTHPTTHGVYGFAQRLSDISHIFDLENHKVVFDELGTDFNDWLRTEQRIFGEQEEKPLTEVEEPFIAIERDFGGHVPYARYDVKGRPRYPENGREYYQKYGHDIEKMVADYECSIDDWFNRLDERIRILQERGIEENTLVIATSDHGELLGEHGQVGHDYPAAPGIVHVPTTFIHPDIQSGEVTDGVFRHADLLPTIMDILNYEQWDNLDGMSRLDRDLADYGTCYYNRTVNDYIRKVNSNFAEILPDIHYEIEAIYDEEGGVSSVCSNYLERLLVFIFRSFLLPNGRYTLKNRKLQEAYRAIMKTEQVYGTPKFNEDDFRDLFAAEVSGSRTTSDDHELSDDAQEQLSDLGYI